MAETRAERLARMSQEARSDERDVISVLGRNIGSAAGSAWDSLAETLAELRRRDMGTTRMSGSQATTDAEMFVEAITRRVPTSTGTGRGGGGGGRNSTEVRAGRIQKKLRDAPAPRPGDPGYRDPNDPLSTWIDVPEGFRAIRHPRIRSGDFTSADAHRQRKDAYEVDPVYTLRDPREQLKRLPPESLRRVQEQMVRAGFDADPSGFLDPGTISAMTKVMGFANNNGLNWQESLSDLERMNTESQDDAHASARSDWARIQREMTRETYLAPSYQTIAEETKNLFRNRLGRDPQDYEIELLSEELSASHAAAFNQEQDIERQAALRQAALTINSQFEEGEEPIATPGMAPDGVAVDPIANFRTKFDELYKPEIDMEKAEVDHQNTTARLLSNFGTLNQRMMG